MSRPLIVLRWEDGGPHAGEPVAWASPAGCLWWSVAMAVAILWAGVIIGWFVWGVR